MVSELLSEDQISHRGLFHWPAIQRLISEHAAEHADHTDHLLALVMLELWQRSYLDAMEGPTFESKQNGVSVRLAQ